MRFKQNAFTSDELELTVIDLIKLLFGRVISRDLYGNLKAISIKRVWL